MSDKTFEDMPENGSVEELKNLLIKPEKNQIQGILKRLDDPMLRAKEISRLLPEALSLSLLKDSKISQIVRPLIDETIKISVKNNPKVMADAIFPALGPGIRKAITSTIMGMIQSLNHVLNHSFSIQGLKWRFEAFRSGRDFAEIVLLHTLVFKVEQIFLIHRETGIVLNHVMAEETISQDPDLVSGMLTAIQDFVNDSFSSGSGDDIETLRIGSDRSVWIEKGEHAFIAAVIRGTPPMELRTRYRELIEEIHLKSGASLAEFDGDPFPFSIFREQLNEGLRSQVKKETKKTSPLIWLIFAGILSLAGLWAFTAYQQRTAWHNYLSALKRQKGIIVLSAEKTDGTYHITGLKDPLKKDPLAQVPDEFKSQVKAVGRWEPFYSLDPDFVLQRAKKILTPPESVSISLAGNTLTAEGRAGLKWIEYFRQTAPAIAGVEAVDAGKLEISESISLHQEIEKLKTYKIYFENNRTDFMPDQEEVISQILRTLTEIERLKNTLKKKVNVVILGHTDSSGTEKLNLRLSRNRAQKILDLLADGGISRELLSISGVGNKHPLLKENSEEDRRFNRAVSFKIEQ